jgi:hypothetical protein
VYKIFEGGISIIFSPENKILIVKALEIYLSTDEIIN